MKIAILNSFSFHFEMFGYIIEYCVLKNIQLDIYTNTYNNMGWIEYYSKNKSNDIMFHSLQSYNKINDYNYIILTTDDDYRINVEENNCKYICIDHHINNRRPIIKTHIGLRRFYNKDIDYILPVFRCINLTEKKNISKKNIVCIGSQCLNCDDLKNIFYDFDNLSFIFIARTIDINILKYKNIKYYVSCNTDDMIEILKKSDYVYIRDNENYIKFIMSGAIPLAFNCLCQLIMPEEMNVGESGYNFKSVITYNNDRKIGLIKPNYDLINDELKELISHKIKIFDKYIL
jgi:hypothetical protein